MKSQCCQGLFDCHSDLFEARNEEEKCGVMSFCGKQLKRLLGVSNQFVGIKTVSFVSAGALINFFVHAGGSREKEKRGRLLILREGLDGALGNVS